MDSLFQSARGPCRLESLAASSGPGRHCPLRTILRHCYAPLLSLVGCICQPMWKPGDPVLAELVWMVGVELQTLSTVSEALDPGERRLFFLADQPENRPIRRSQNMKGICKV